MIISILKILKLIIRSKYYNKLFENYEKNIIKISYLFQLIFLIFTRKKNLVFFL